MTEYKNYPFREIAEAMLEHINNGCDVYQKYTCAGCGARLALDIPNVIFPEGTCDRCDAVTDIEKDGCNYMLIGPGEVVSAALKKMEEDND